MIMLKSFLLDLMEGNSPQHNNNNNHLNHLSSRRAARLVIKSQDGQVQEDQVIYDDVHAPGAAFCYDSSSSSSSDTENSEDCHAIFGSSGISSNFQITIESDNAMVHEILAGPPSFSRNSSSSSLKSSSKSGRRSHMLKKRKNAPKKGSRWESQVSSAQKQQQTAAAPVETLLPLSTEFNDDLVSIMSRVSQQQHQLKVALPPQLQCTTTTTTPTLTHSPPSIPKRQLSIQSFDSSSSHSRERISSRTWKASSPSKSGAKQILLRNAVFPARQECSKPAIQFPDFAAMAKCSNSSSRNEIDAMKPSCSSRPLRRPVRQPSSEFDASPIRDHSNCNESEFSDLMRGLTLDYLVADFDDEEDDNSSASMASHYYQHHNNNHQDLPPRQPMDMDGSRRQGRRASMF